MRGRRCANRGWGLGLTAAPSLDIMSVRALPTAYCWLSRGDRREMRLAPKVTRTNEVPFFFFLAINTERSFCMCESFLRLPGASFIFCSSSLCVCKYSGFFLFLQIRRLLMSNLFLPLRLIVILCLLNIFLLFCLNHCNRNNRPVGAASKY